MVFYYLFQDYIWEFNMCFLSSGAQDLCISYAPLLVNTKYDTSDLLSDHIDQYDTLCNRLYPHFSTASPTDRYTLPFSFQKVFKSPKAKAALLLRSLPELMYNIVDNLQTKEDLTYDHVYNNLLDLKIPTTISADNKAYK